MALLTRPVRLAVPAHTRVELRSHCHPPPYHSGCQDSCRMRHGVARRPHPSLVSHLSSLSHASFASFTSRLRGDVDGPDRHSTAHVVGQAHRPAGVICQGRISFVSISHSSRLGASSAVRLRFGSSNRSARFGVSLAVPGSLRHAAAMPGRCPENREERTPPAVEPRREHGVEFTDYAPQSKILSPALPPAPLVPPVPPVQPYGRLEGGVFQVFPC